VLAQGLKETFPGAKGYSAANLWKMRIIICKSKDKTVVEYALNQSNVPIGVATYKLSTKVPQSMKDFLPNPEEIAHRLGAFDKGQ